MTEPTTTIAPHAAYATLINVFTVEPERADELAGLLTRSTEEVMQHLPGFRTANIHLSTDRTRVVNYAQWDSAEAFAAMQVRRRRPGAHAGGRRDRDQFRTHVCTPSNRCTPRRSATAGPGSDRPPADVDSFSSPRVAR